jgi:KaiC/GvpD/RAD55 family RecA-like ATPase
MTHDKILKILCAKYKKEIRVIDSITKSPFKFTHDVMANEFDNRSVRLAYLGVFTQKRTNNKTLKYGIPEYTG